MRKQYSSVKQKEQFRWYSLKPPTQLNTIWTLSALCFASAYAQANPCADSKAPRFGVIAVSKPGPSDTEYLQGMATGISRFQKELIKQLPSSCIVKNIDMFSNPASYPASKGSVLSEISAAPSFRNPEIAPIAVEVLSIDGAYFE